MIPDPPRPPVDPALPPDLDLDALLRALPQGRSLAEEHARSQKSGLKLLLPGDPQFPAPLASMPQPPKFLYRWGNHPSRCPTIAVVGSRRASPAGERLAFRMGKELAAEGWRVISGLARGIDRAVLEGATLGSQENREVAPIAILGNGLPEIYPPENSDLAAEIVTAGGALFSELPTGAPPRREHFPRRNRLISAWARGVVVVEATMRSGSLITATWALEQGREVLAVPGPIEGPRHQGCHQLIRDGATLVTSVPEIIDALELVAGALPPIPPLLREAFLGGERDLAKLLDHTGIPPARLLEGWRQLLAEDEQGPESAPPPPGRRIGEGVVDFDGSGRR